MHCKSHSILMYPQLWGYALHMLTLVSRKMCKYIKDVQTLDEREALPLRQNGHWHTTQVIGSGIL